jgi:hypothetical protein
MKKRLEQFGICVVVIAEGAGQVSLQFYLLGRMCAPQCIGENFALWWQMILEIKFFSVKKFPNLGKFHQIWSFQWFQQHQSMHSLLL